MKRKALVIVLGELSRSPRMQYHCLSLASNDYDVSVIANGDGVSGDKACERLESNGNIHQRLMMNDPIDFKKWLPSILAYIIKPIWQTLLLCLQLLKTPKPDVVIVQNPPSIPTLPVIYLYTCLIRSRLIIDWHNYGFSILRLNIKRDNLIVRLSKFIEIYFGRLADAGFCVSEAMQHELMIRYHITYPVYVLYDKPPSQFVPLSTKKKHEFLLRMQEQIPAFRQVAEEWKEVVGPESHKETLFTCIHTSHQNKVSLKPQRPALLLSSTSWTEDEDFGVLLEALEKYDQSCDGQADTCVAPNLPKLVCVITGKGPLKTFYESRIERCKFKNIRLVLPWLSAEDYPMMVGASDIGISLHSSSSGVDLPMKVVDMFGCGIPVLAYKYKAISELVIEDYFGRTFNNSTDLFNQLTDLLSDFNQNAQSTGSVPSLERYRKNIIDNFLRCRWDTNWNKVARPIFDRLSR